MADGRGGDGGDGGGEPMHRVIVVFRAKVARTRYFNSMFTEQRWTTAATAATTAAAAMRL